MDYNKNYQYYKKKARDENFNGGSKWRSQNYNNNNKSSYFGPRPRSRLSLEKEFCLAVGGVTWEKVLETQKYMYQDEKVLNWKDSAVQEAFWNAKKRFLAKMLGEPCNIELPDPDIFIDEIDWDSDVDPKLILELDNSRNTNVDMSCEDDQKYSGVVPEQDNCTSTGWGDAEEGDQHLENQAKQDGVYDHWGDEGAKKDGVYDHWGDEGVNNPTKDCSNSWEEGYAYNVPYDKFMLNFEQNRHDNNNGGSAWNGYRNKQWEHNYNKKSNYGGRNTSRYKVSPVHYNRDDQPLIDGYGGRKRGNFSNSTRPPLVQWKPVLRQR